MFLHHVFEKSECEKGHSVFRPEIGDMASS